MNGRPVGFVFSSMLVHGAIFSALASAPAAVQPDPVSHAIEFGTITVSDGIRRGHGFARPANAFLLDAIRAGLGDGIEAERSNWIRGFDGRSLDDPRAAGWTVRRDGGEFDQFTGATITPRAIVQAVHTALQYHEKNRKALYETPAEPIGKSPSP